MAALLAASACTSATAPTPSASIAAPPSGSPTATSIPTLIPLVGQIAFLNDPLSPTAHLQIYIENADGTNVRQLDNSSFDDGPAAISPDGTRVIFTRVGGPLDQMFMVNVDGSGLHQVTPGGCPAGSRCSDDIEGHAWSPDGSQIVFNRAILRGSETIPSNVGEWVMHADGSAAHQVTLANVYCPDPCAQGAQDNNADWSPDGKRLVFRRDQYSTPEQFGIFTVALDGSDLRRVTPVQLNPEDPAWSPDGRLIAFQTPHDPPALDSGLVQNIYTIHPDGTGLTLLTPKLGGLASNHASWSPDGSQLVFSHAPSGPLGGDLFVMNRDGSGLHVLMVTPLNENAPFWGRVPG